jgi:hypothetical protein
MVRLRAWEESCARPISQIIPHMETALCCETISKIRKAPHIDASLCAEVFQFWLAFAYAPLFSLPFFTMTDDHSFIKER